MKTFITLCCLAIAGVLTAQSADEAAIKKVIQMDTEAWIQRDFATWQSLWHHSEQASILTVGSGDRTLGWENIQPAMKDYFESGTDARPITFNHSNHFFNIQGDQAFVSFEQATTPKFTVGGWSPVNKTFEVRNLVKVDGEWKIANQVTAPALHEGRPQDVMDHLRLASGVLMDAERVEDAAKIPALVAELYPDAPSGYWGMGYYAVEQKDKASALKHLEKAMSLFDDAIPPGLQSLYEQAEALE